MAKNKIRWALVAPILFIALGIMMIIQRGSFINTMGYVLGVVIVVIGVIELIDAIDRKAFLGSSITKLLVGAALIICSGLISSIIIFVVAVALIVYGILGIFGKGNLIISIIMLAAGILLIVGGVGGSLLDICMLIAGVCMVVYGILGLSAALK